jgi:hypothetical protein
MQLSFFPSPSLAFYVGKTFLFRTVAMLAMLVLVLQVLDLLSEAGDVLSYPGNGEPELWRYVSLRAPQITATFLPFAVLLGTLVTLTTLNHNSEVISMKAAGLSAHQILAPLMLVSAAIALASFVFNERIVTRSVAALDAWDSVEFGGGASRCRDLRPPGRQSGCDIEGFARAPRRRCVAAGGCAPLRCHQRDGPDPRHDPHGREYHARPVHAGQCHGGGSFVR